MRLVNSLSLARRLSRCGIRRLYVLDQLRSLRAQAHWLPRWPELTVWAAPLMPPDELRRQVIDLLADQAFLDEAQAMPCTEEQFRARLEDATERINMAAQDVARLLPKLFASFHKARLAIEQHQAPQWADVRQDIALQLSALTQRDFLSQTPWRWLREFPRYLQAIAHRLDRLTHGSLPRDQAAQAEIGPWWQQYVDRSADEERRGRYDPELEWYRWMIEEYRVSVFAQPLGTSIPVSPQRLKRQWQKLQA